MKVKSIYYSIIKIKRFYDNDYCYSLPSDISMYSKLLSLNKYDTLLGLQHTSQSHISVFK